MILVGNKSDLIDHRKVSSEEIKAYCASKNMIYVECSAKEDDRIKDIFVELARSLMRRDNLKNLPTSPLKKGKDLAPAPRD